LDSPFASGRRKRSLNGLQPSDVEGPRNIAGTRYFGPYETAVATGVSASMKNRLREGYSVLVVQALGGVSDIGTRLGPKHLPRFE